MTRFERRVMIGMTLVGLILAVPLVVVHGLREAHVPGLARMAYLGHSFILEMPDLLDALFLQPTPGVAPTHRLIRSNWARSGPIYRLATRGRKP